MSYDLTKEEATLIKNILLEHIDEMGSLMKSFDEEEKIELEAELKKLEEIIQKF